MTFYGLPISNMDVWIITYRETIRFKDQNKDKSMYYEILDVFMARELAVEKLLYLRDKEQNSDQYKECLSSEIFYNEESYKVTYICDGKERTEEYFIENKIAQG